MARDLFASVALAAVAAGYYFLASGIGSSALADEVGASGLPIAYAVVLAVIACLMALQSGLRHLLRRPPERAARETPEFAYVLRRAGGVLAIGIGYLLIVTVVGYLIALVAVLAAMLMYLGERPSGRVALAAVGGAGLFWLLFDRLLGIPMPGLWGL